MIRSGEVVVLFLYFWDFDILIVFDLLGVIFFYIIVRIGGLMEVIEIMYVRVIFVLIIVE